jgi:hypothetical protein
MADLLAIRTALADQLTSITGLRTMADARDSISPPVAIVLPGQPFVKFGDTAQGPSFPGALTVNLIILVIISDAPTLERSQKALDMYLGIGEGPAESIPNAIMNDPSLGGVVDYCEPTTVTNYGRIEYAGQQYFGARCGVTIGTI